MNETTTQALKKGVDFDFRKTLTSIGIEFTYLIPSQIQKSIHY